MEDKVFTDRGKEKDDGEGYIYRVGLTTFWLSEGCIRWGEGGKKTMECEGGRWKSGVNRGGTSVVGRGR